MNNSLQTHTILVGLKLSAPGMRRPDRAARHELAANKETSEDAWSVSKLLFPHDPLKPLRQFDQDFRRWFNQQTAPFGDLMRIIRIEALDTLQTAYRERAEKRSALVREFLGHYVEHIERAKRALNGEFDASQYPDPARLNFDHELEVLPVPSRDNLLVEVEQEVLAELREQTEQSIRNAVDQARLDTLRKMAEPLAKLTKRVKAFPQLWAELRETAQAALNCNVEGDPAIDALAAAIKEISLNYDPAHMKPDGDQAAAARGDAKAILSRMAKLLEEEK